MESKSQINSYKKYLFENDLEWVRKILILSFVLYSSFGLMDYFLDVVNLGVYFTIRYLIFDPLIIAIYLLSYTKIFIKIYTFLLTFAFVIGGTGIVVMLTIDQDHYSYYGGLFLIFGVGFFMLRAPWQFIAIGSAFIMSLYMTMVLLYQFDHLTEAISYSVFYVSFIIVALYGALSFSNVRYQNYLYEMSILEDKYTLERKNDQNIVNLETANYATIYSLARLAESKDDFTGNHLNRVGELSVNLAKEIDDSIYKKNDLKKEVFLESIEHASKLHDIGKIGISEEILMKPGIYTSEERLRMQEHCKIGSGTLSQIKKLYPRNAYINMGIKIAHSHHENYDGTGYPDGLTGLAIPFCARLVSVIDVYDALISERPYKKAFSHIDAIREIESLSGSKFDKDIVDVFLRTITV